MVQNRCRLRSLFHQWRKMGGPFPLSVSEWRSLSGVPSKHSVHLDCNQGTTKICLPKPFPPAFSSSFWRLYNQGLTKIWPQTPFPRKTFMTHRDTKGLEEHLRARVIALWCKLKLVFSESFRLKASFKKKKRCAFEHPLEGFTSMDLTKAEIQLCLEDIHPKELLGDLVGLGSQADSQAPNTY